MVSGAGVALDPEKVKAIVNMPLPRNLKEIRTFLGMVNYYRRFVNGLSESVEPLTRLLKKGASWKVTPEMRNSVATCKRALCSAPVLAYPDFNKRFIVTTDATEVGIGAVLS